MPYRTLGELRAALRTRLGFSAAGAAAGVNQEIINNFLSEAQITLYWTHDWARLRKYSDVTIGLQETLVDYPSDCNPERIRAVSVLDNNIWTPPLPKGIDPALYTYQSNYARPDRWEPYEQMEFWPAADQVYTARVFYVKNLLPFVVDEDVATIDDSLVFAVALADAKAHYRHPDAANYGSKSQALLSQLKAKNWGKTVFHPHDYTQSEVLAKPVTV